MTGDPYERERRERWERRERDREFRQRGTDDKTGGPRDQIKEQKDKEREGDAIKVTGRGGGMGGGADGQMTDDLDSF